MILAGGDRGVSGPSPIGPERGAQLLRAADAEAGPIHIDKIDNGFIVTQSRSDGLTNKVSRFFTPTKPEVQF